MNILELDSYNLDDAVKFNDRLNTRLWDDKEHLRSDVRARLLEIAEDFKEFLGLSDLDVEDITISGSNAAYTYTPNSDIDLHLVAKVPEDEVYRELFDAKKAQYNDQHNIKIGGYDVELYVETAGKPPISQGMYSVLNNNWIQVPRRVKSNVDDISTKNKFETVGRSIERAVKSGNLSRMDLLARKIKKMRQTGLESHGEFGPENLAFKMLRTQGKIKQLYDARNAAKDQELSLKERRQPHSVFAYGFKHEEARPVAEQQDTVDTPQLSDEEILKDFINFCVAELKIEQMPTIKLRRDPQWSVVNKTFGRYIDDQHLLEVAFGQRHIMDVLRTVAHELTHKHQHERETVPSDAGETGSPYENEANARAGVLMRDYGRLHPELFDSGQAELAEGASGYIPTKAQARDPRFSMALTQDIKPGQLGKEANKLKLKTDKQGHPQIAKASGLFEKLALELNQFKRKGTLAESIEQLDEVRMAPSNLQQWARSPAAEGIRAGFEAELIFRDTTSDENDGGGDMEPDYDADERCRSIQDIIDFFEDGEYGGMSQRQRDRLEEALNEKYMEWQDEAMYLDWADERDDLIKEAWLRDKPMDERIHAALVDGMDLDDAEADRIQAAGDAAPRFTRLSDQQAYEQQNKDYELYREAVEIAEEILQEDVEQTIAKEDGFYDEVLDDFRSNFYTDDDSGFFSDVGLVYMSDVAEEFGLDWPYMTGGGGNDGTREWDEIGNSLSDTIDMPVKVSSGYHSATRKEGLWIVEPDSSLEPDDREDYGLEIVSPPLPLLTALEKLQEVTDWANDSSEGDAYTNSSTGLHMGVSVPFKGGDVDYLKLVLFLGDEYVLKQFGREANTYTKSAMSKFKENIKGGRTDPMSVIKLMQHGLLELAQREVQKGVGEGKYTSVHVQKGYIEFRSAGGDWLAEESADPEKLQNTMLRYARAMSLAANPGEERREYAKKLYKLIAPEGDSQLALFSQFAAGELTAEQLKKQWAEKTIGTEKKMNQRWRLYQNVDGRWEPVPGAEWNGYSEDQVKTAVWSKYGREALDSGEYQLVNMGEQSWEVYDVTTGKTLEIVKGKSKGEVADAVYDKYVDQGIGFQVRPYVDPATMTPRAKLAQRIVKPKQEPKADTVDTYRGKWEFFYAPTGRVLDAVNDASIMQARAVLADTQRRYDDLPADQIQMRKADAEQEPNVGQNFSANPNPTVQEPNQVRMPNGVPVWEVYERGNGHVVHVVADHTMREAHRQAQTWLTGAGVEDPSLFAVRPKVLAAGERNLSAPQDATQRVGSWAIHDVTLGREISRMDNVAWQQASDRAEELERSTGHNMSVRGLNENFADGKNPQDKGDSVRHGIPKGATIAQLEKAAKAPGRKGQLARWQLNMRRGKKK